MHTVKLKIDNSIYENIMFLLKNLNLEGLKIESDKEELIYDENGIPYINTKETKEIEKVLRNPECYEVSHSKIISLDL